MSTGALDGRAVVVTGGAQGLGRAFVEAILAEGGRVVVNDVEADTLDAALAELGDDRASGHAADIATWDGAASLIAACVERHGRVDGLVNNAGLMRFRDPWDEDEAGLRHIVEVNVLGTMFCGIHAMRAMEPGAAIVNIASESQFGYAGMCAYAATKGGVSSLTYAWAADLEPRGIRVNGVAPNAQTRMSPRDADGNLLPRPSAASVAPVVTYLLSDASAAVNGRILQFNGTSLSPIVKQRLVDEPVVRDAWTPQDIAEACAGAYADELGRASVTGHPA